ncbi:hypothetical protein WCD74_26290 [Actinomycetospora sp. OC33-EN08]|uniref:Uncharacterized protein n=1 Tax=Actinomycetospora aurantiaca TaxID=3129233 RepID=A0ABU8MVE8_9PSEU
MTHDQHRRPVDAAPHPYQPHQPTLMAYPMVPGGGPVLTVNGVPQPLGRGSSRVLVGAIVFATCVVPLVIIAVVLLMMPDFGSLTGGTDVPSVTVTR